MQNILPCHEMSVSAQSGRKIIRLVQCRPEDEFYTDEKEFTFIWQFPGTGIFSFDSGTNCMMGNDFMYVDGGRRIKFDDMLEDSIFIMLIVDKKEFVNFFAGRNYNFAPPRRIKQLTDDAFSPQPYIVHYPTSRPLIKAMDLIISDFRDMPAAGDLAVIDTMRFFKTLAGLPRQEYSPLRTATRKDPALYVMKRIRENYDTVTLADLAKELNYSASYISRSLKEFVGMSFKQLLSYRRRLVAMGLLEKTTLSLEQVAARVGFDTYAGFYKFWTKSMGISPRRYREKTAAAAAGDFSRFYSQVYCLSPGSSDAEHS